SSSRAGTPSDSRFQELMALPLRLSTLLLLGLLAAPLSAQTGAELRGRAVGESGQPVAGASVVAQSLPDTTRTVAGLTTQDGHFRITVLPGSYRLRITHLGYRTHSREITVSPETPLADLGTIRLSL